MLRPLAGPRVIGMKHVKSAETGNTDPSTDVKLQSSPSMTAVVPKKC